MIGLLLAVAISVAAPRRGRPDADAPRRRSGDADVLGARRDRRGPNWPSRPRARYVYIGAAFILLLAMEARLGASLRGAWALVAALAVVGAVVANLHVLRAGERALRGSDTEVRASMAAVELAAPVVAPTFVAAPVAAPQLSAGEYFPRFATSVRPPTRWANSRTPRKGLPICTPTAC